MRFPQFLVQRMPTPATHEPTTDYGALELLQEEQSRLHIGDYCLRSAESRQFSIIKGGTGPDQWELSPVNALLTLANGTEVRASVLQLLPDFAGSTRDKIEPVYPAVIAYVPASSGIGIGDTFALYGPEDERYQVKSLHYPHPAVALIEAILI